MAQELTVIKRSVSKLIKSAAVTAAFLVASVWMIHGGAVGSSFSERTELLGWICGVTFGLLLIAIVHRLLFGHPTPIVLSAKGFQDKRLLVNEVPWDAVSRISVWSYSTSSLPNTRTFMLRIQLNDEATQTKEFTSLGQTRQWLNKASFLDGIFVSSADLEISFSELCTMFRNHLADHNPAAIDDIEL